MVTVLLLLRHSKQISPFGRKIFKRVGSERVYAAECATTPRRNYCMGFPENIGKVRAGTKNLASQGSCVARKHPRKEASSRHSEPGEAVP